MKDKDPATLPTVFIVDRITDILQNYDIQRTEACTPKAGFNPSKLSNRGVQASPNYDAPPSVITKPKHTTNGSIVASKNCSTKPSNDGLVKKYHDRKSSLQYQPVRRIDEQHGMERRHTHPLAAVDEKSSQYRSSNENEKPHFDSQDCKTPTCSKDSHIYKVEGQKVNYSVDEDIQLNFLKYCNDGLRCNSWADNVHAILSDRKGRVTDFSKWKVSDGGWLLLCKPKCEGPLTAIVKANEKPITSFDINVYSVLTEPIEV